MMNRRGFLAGMLAVPAVASASSLMAMPRNPARLLRPDHFLVYRVEEDHVLDAIRYHMMTIPDPWHSSHISQRFANVEVPRIAVKRKPRLLMEPGQYVDLEHLTQALRKV